MAAEYQEHDRAAFFSIRVFRQVPYHRMWVVWVDGELVWDRRARTDVRPPSRPPARLAPIVALPSVLLAPLVRALLNW